MVTFDKKNRILTNQQLAAMFAKANRSGISDKQLNLKVLTSLNDEIIAARGNNVEDPIGSGIKSIIAKRIVTVKPKKVKDVVEAVAKNNGITKDEARRDLESSNIIPPGISDEAVIGASKEEQFNQIKQGLQQDRIKKIEREIISKEIAKVRHGTVAQKLGINKKTFSNLNPETQERLKELAKKNADRNRDREIARTTRRRFQELRDNVKTQQEERGKLIKIGQIRDKLISQQDELVKKQRKVIDESGTGEKISRDQLRVLRGKAIGIDPLTVAIQEGGDKQFQLQKKSFELRQLGFSPRLAEERAKIILNQ